MRPTVTDRVASHSAVSCAKMAKQIEMLFRFWTRLCRMKPRRRGLMSNYFDHLFKIAINSWKGKKERKEVYLYSAFIAATTLKALRRGSHSFTCKQHHACLSFVCVHQMSPPQQLRQQTSNCSSLLTKYIGLRIDRSSSLWSSSWNI